MLLHRGRGDLRWRSGRASFAYSGFRKVSPRGPRSSRRVSKQGADFGRRRERRAFAEKRSQARRHLEARRGGADRRLKQIFPRTRAKPGMRGRQHRYRTRDTGGAAAANRFDKRQRFAMVIEKHVSVAPAGALLATVDRTHDARTRVVNIMKAPPPTPELCGSTRPSIACTATAASMALPPLRRISRRASTAIGFAATMTDCPWRARFLGWRASPAAPATRLHRGWIEREEREREDTRREHTGEASCCWAWILF